MSTIRMTLLAAAAVAISISGCGDDDDTNTVDASHDAHAHEGDGATEALAAAAIAATSAGGEKNTIQGTATFVQDGSTVTLRVVLSNCPEGEHGFHIHQNASCADTTGKTTVPAGGAGPHWAVGNEGAGGHGSHIGDIGNITCDAEGAADETFTRTDWTIDAGAAATDVQGHSVIVHAMLDTEQPGDEGMASAGGRIGCGLITVVSNDT